MNRDEVLRRSRQKNSFLDEKEQFDSMKSFGFGGVIIVLLCVVFSILNTIRGQSFYEFGVIIFAYMASTSWKTYISTKKKSFMIQGSISTVGAIVTLVGYIIQV